MVNHPGKTIVLCLLAICVFTGRTCSYASYIGHSG